jgi:hypothetical protein
MSEPESHQWISQILRALAELRETERSSERAVGLEARLAPREPEEERRVGDATTLLSRPQPGLAALGPTREEPRKMEESLDRTAVLQAGTPEETIATLNRLLAACKDGEQEYRTAAHDVTLPAFRGVFLRYAR